MLWTIILVPGSAVAAGYDYFIYHGGPDSYFTCDCNYCGVGTGHSRT